MKIKANIINHNSSFFGEIEIKDNIFISISIISSQLDYKSDFIMPAFIDSHTHGGYGLDFGNIFKWTKDDFEIFRNNIFREGVTNVAMTTITLPLIILDSISNWYNKHNVDFIQAWHIEGPFISREKKGAHDEGFIIDANESWLHKISHINKKIVVTSALDINGNADILNKMISNNFFVSLGHSNAKFNDVKYFLANNFFDRYTHLFNAMSSFSHRSPGIAFCAFAVNKGWVELIADGFHVNNDLVKYTFDNIGSDRLILVSDSLSLKGQNDGNFFLGSIPITKIDNLCYIKDTTILAGSCFKYIDVVKNFFKTTNCTLQDIVKITSFNYFKSIHLDNLYGAIREKNIADFIIVDSELNLKQTYKNGVKVYQK